MSEHLMQNEEPSLPGSLAHEPASPTDPCEPTIHEPTTIIGLHRDAEQDTRGVIGGLYVEEIDFPMTVEADEEHIDATGDNTRILQNHADLEDWANNKFDGCYEIMTFTPETRLHAALLEMVYAALAAARLADAGLRERAISTLLDATEHAALKALQRETPELRWTRPGAESPAEPGEG